MGEALIIDAVRTPRGIGKPGKGALSHLHPTHLGATVLKAIAERNKLDTKTVDDVIISTPPAITQSSWPDATAAVASVTAVMPPPQKRSSVTPEAVMS